MAKSVILVKSFVTFVTNYILDQSILEIFSMLRTSTRCFHHFEFSRLVEGAQVAITG